MFIIFWEAFVQNGKTEFVSESGLTQCVVGDLPPCTPYDGIGRDSFASIESERMTFCGNRLCSIDVYKVVFIDQFESFEVSGMCDGSSWDKPKETAMCELSFQTFKVNCDKMSSHTC